MSPSPNDAGIPVLTEVIKTPIYGIDLPERRVTPSESVRHADGPPTEASTAAALDAATLERLTREVSEQVLQQLLGRVDFVLEQRIRDSLADVLQTAVDGLASKLREGLKTTLEDVVTRAVSQELGKSRILKK